MVIYMGKRTIKALIIGILILGLVAGATSYTTTTASKGAAVEQWLRSGQVVKQVSTTRQVVALTFDDGPSATFTPQVLDILKEHQAKATFFVVGKRAEKYPELIQRMAQEGHEIANHTYNHPMSPVNPARLAEELDKTDEVIYSITEKHTQYFRPPGGKCTRATVEPALAKGYKVILWTAQEDPMDWADPGVKRIVDRVVENARNGSIIILHDCGGDRTQTVEALPRIIKGLKEKGYGFVTVTELLKGGSTVPAVEEFRMENWME
ncbi:MAG: polysaccharide deacetylase family protein [Bacillota bacterium]|nr:polysaccharide deacetylase family protein [Bacillota bacterium]